MQRTIRIFKIALASVATFFMALLVWLYLLDENFAVKQSVTVRTPIAEARQNLADLHQWHRWSPWLQLDSMMTFEVSVEPDSAHATLKFNNLLAGATQFTTRSVSDAGLVSQIHQSLKFEKPFRCRATSNWVLTKLDSTTTRIDWNIAGKLPFSYRYLTSRLSAILELDMQRGMAMLKDFLETGTVDSRVCVQGIVTTPEIFYVGIQSSCISSQIDSAMQATFNELIQQAHFLKIPFEGTMACYYDFAINANKTCTYVCAVRTAGPLQMELPLPLVEGAIKSTKALKINFVGDYKYISNGWAAGLTYIRSKNINPRRRVHPFELYVQTETKSSVPSDWKTELYIPVK